MAEISANAQIAEWLHRRNSHSIRGRLETHCPPHQLHWMHRLGVAGLQSARRSCRPAVPHSAAEDTRFSWTEEGKQASRNVALNWDMKGDWKANLIVEHFLTFNRDASAKAPCSSHVATIKLQKRNQAFWTPLPSWCIHHSNTTENFDHLSFKRHKELQADLLAQFFNAVRMPLSHFRICFEQITVYNSQLNCKITHTKSSTRNQKWIIPKSYLPLHFLLN